MNNLEKLYEARKALDKVLKDVEIEQSKLIKEITEKRDVGWDRMFSDLYSLRKYSNFIDTGIDLYKNRAETLGFEIRDNEICVLSWKHINFYGNQTEPKTETYFFSITRDKPFETNSYYKDWMKYVIYAIENWNEVMKEIEIRLSKQMELEMKKKISDSEEKQIELKKQLNAINT